MKEETRRELEAEAEKNWWDRKDAGVASEGEAHAAAAGRAVVQSAVASRDGRAVSVTRVERAESVEAHAATAEERRREMARRLTMSHSILSGQEGVRRYSVPRRGLRPHFQLFSKESGVEEAKGGGYRLSRGAGRQGLDGSVWFI